MFCLNLAISEFLSSKSGKFEQFFLGKKSPFYESSKQTKISWPQFTVNSIF
jgi:hypothetical protein